MVCRRERTIGSNRVTCRTEAQMEAEREMARDELDRGDMQMIRSPGCCKSSRLPGPVALFACFSPPADAGFEPSFPGIDSSTGR